ncbi:MAG: hypothetical protein ACRENW_01775 [Thermodesulfobacteriota bacterium]
MADEPQKVVVKDIQMAFDSMVIFMIKWALATIPAFIVLVLLGLFIWFVIIKSFIY